MRSWTAGSISSSSPISSGGSRNSSGGRSVRGHGSDLNGVGGRECAKCGSCTAVCPVYRVTGRESLTARGKLHLLGTDLAAGPSAGFEDLFSQCLLCGACESVCPRELPVRRLIVDARSRFSFLYGRHGLRRSLVRRVLSRPALIEGLVKAGLALGNLPLLPKDSGLRIKLGLLEGERAGKPAGRTGEAFLSADTPNGVGYFVGCLAGYLQPSIADATRRLVRHFGGVPVEAPRDQRCCGLAAWSAGDMDAALHLAKTNIRAFASSSGPVLTSCTSCFAHLKRYPELFQGDSGWREKALRFSSRVREFSSFVLQLSPGAPFRASARFRLLYHEPCHLRFGGEDRDAPRILLRSIDRTALVEPEGGPHCCGQGGLFYLGYPELADRIFTMAWKAYAEAGADIVVTGCSSCLLQFQAGLALRRASARVMHPAVFLAGCLDIDF